VDNPSNSRADGAYDRALAAYQEKSYEVARRWALEALAHNRQHSGARALLGRLDAARAASSPFQAGASASEVISTDPTVLVGRASGPAPSHEPIEPTVLIRHNDPPRRVPDTDVRPSYRQPSPPPRESPRAPVDPTVIAQPRMRSGSSSRAKSSFSLGGALQSLGERMQRRTPSSRQPSAARARTTSSPGSTRGALLAIGMVALGAAIVLGLYLGFRWFFPAGQVLTITKPTGGTIVGPGIECGTRGSKCSTTVTTGEPIELDTQPDKEYVFSGYTGDCAPAGRTAMTEPRTCGATFDRVASAAPVVTFRLTITKPEGGTVIGAGGILCGVNGSTCSADIPSGLPVTLKADAADGYAWEQFTGDCPGTGEMTMTSAKTCGATFIKTAGPAVNVGPRPQPPPSPRPHPATPAPTVAQPPTVAPPTTPGAQAPQPSGPIPVNPPGFSGSTPTSPTGATSSTDKPPPPPISADDHAKQEIQVLIKNYCDALGTLKPASVRALFHLDNERELKDKYKEYKSLKCTLADPPTYDRLDSSAAGGAQLKFPMKQVVEMRSGGAPQKLDLMVTMVVSRKSFQSPWLIDRVQYEEKPK
jgi:hypothetical protein